MKVDYQIQQKHYLQIIYNTFRVGMKAESFAIITFALHRSTIYLIIPST